MSFFPCQCTGAGIACWLERRSRDRKVASSNPGRNGGRILSSRVNFLCRLFIRCPFHPRVTAVARIRPSHSAKSTDGRLHLNTHTSLTQRSRSGLSFPLSNNSTGTYPETSSQATCQGTFGHSRLSSLSQCGPILAERMALARASSSPLKTKQNKNNQAGTE